MLELQSDPSEALYIGLKNKLIRPVPDFPKPGILFRYISPLMFVPEARKSLLRLMDERFKSECIGAVAAHGTAGAVGRLFTRLGRVFAAFSFLISLEWLAGSGYLTAAFRSPVHSVITY